MTTGTQERQVINITDYVVSENVVTDEVSKNSTTEQVVKFCTDNNLDGEVVGVWVWVYGYYDDVTRAKMQEAGFHYNGGRKVWQHACGHYRPRAPYDPRNKYGRKKIRKEEE